MSNRILFILFMFPLFVSGQVISYGNKAVAVDNKVATYTPVSSVTTFSPSDLDSLVLWLKADAGVTKDGSNYVSAWADQSGNGNNAVQATGTSQPIFIADGGDSINHKPVIRFDGTGDYMSFSRISNIRTCFFVIKATRTTAFFIDDPILGDDTYYDFFGGYPDGTKIFDAGYSSQYIRSGTIFNNGSQIAPVYSANKPLIYATISIVASGDVRANRITNDRASYGFWQGDYVEIIIYSSALSDIDRQQVEQYLKTKYNHY